MTEPRHEREEFELGEVIAVYGPDPNRRVWVVVDVGPPDSDRLIDLAAERGVGSAELARTLLHAALEDIPPPAAPTPDGPDVAMVSPSERPDPAAPKADSGIAAELAALDRALQ